MTREEQIREQMINLARSLKGSPYEHYAQGPLKFDCAGFIWYLYNTILGIDIFEEGYGKSTTGMTMTSKYGKLEIYNEGLKEINYSLIKPADILFFHRQSLKANEVKEDNYYPGHCGLYLGNKKFIHCTIKTNHVSINSFEKEIWVKRLVGTKNIIGGYYENSKK